MRFIDEFRDNKIAAGLVDKMNALLGKTDKTVTLMEICGTHTMAISRAGIRRLVPKNLRLVSGPGCPVCVTDQAYIDKAVAYARHKDVIITTFGDMMRVPGTHSTLEKEKAAGANVYVVYSPWDTLKVCTDNPDKKVVFLAVGFETTAPATAATVLDAEKLGLSNFHILCAHKTVPQALDALCSDPQLKVNGFLCPGHVSVIIGGNAYAKLAEKYKTPCVVTGFEPLDILQGILMLAEQSLSGVAKVENQYARAVTPEGNTKAQSILYSVFKSSDAVWRGIGAIPGSGLALKPEYEKFDMEKTRIIKLMAAAVNKACRCGDVLKGIINPFDCKLFAKACTPESPVGPCMVSTEGTCAAYYKYDRS